MRETDGTGDGRESEAECERKGEPTSDRRESSRTDRVDGTTETNGDWERAPGLGRRGFLTGVAAASTLPVVGEVAADERDWSPASESERTYTVTQGDATVEVEPLNNGESAESFYGFDGDGSDTSTGIETSDASLLFLYEGPNGPSLVVIHDAPGDGSDGKATLSFGGLPTGAGSWVVTDNDADFGSSTDASPDWAWKEQFNDGGVFRGGLDGEFSLTVDPAFNEEAGRSEEKEGRITDWQLLSGDAASPERTSLALDQPITIEPGSTGPSVSVSAAPSTARPGESVEFAADTDADVRSYEWTFGDGATGTGGTVTHAYDDPGEYTAEVTVTTTDGTTATGSATVVVPEGGVSVSIAPADPSVGETVEFSADGDDAEFSGFDWEFGDGGTATGNPATHTYGRPGEYTAAVVVIDADGEKRFGTATVGVTAGDVTVEVTDDDPVAGEPVRLTASGDATDVGGFSWTFGDGETGSGETVTHTYGESGEYLVSVTLTTADGEKRYGATRVTIGEPLGAVTADPKVVPPGETVAFAAAGAPTGSASFSWTFGDGATGTGRRTSHAFSDPGEYTVEVVRSGDDGTTSGSVTVTVTDGLDFAYDPGDPAVGEELRFDAVGEESYAWDFGDGTFATGNSVTHTYEDPGEVTVAMSPSDSLLDGDVPDELVEKTVDVAPKPIRIANVDQAPSYVLDGAGGTFYVRVDVETDDATVDEVVLTDGDSSVSLTYDEIDRGGDRGTKGVYDADVSVDAFEWSLGENELTVEATGVEDVTDRTSFFVEAVEQGSNHATLFPEPKTDHLTVTDEWELVDRTIEINTGDVLPKEAPITGTKVIDGVAQIEARSETDLGTLETTIVSESELGLNVLGVGLDILAKVVAFTDRNGNVFDFGLEKFQLSGTGSPRSGPKMKVRNPLPKGPGKVTVELDLRPGINVAIDEFRAPFDGPRLLPGDGIWDTYGCAKATTGFSAGKLTVEPQVKGTLHGAHNWTLADAFDPSDEDFPTIPFRPVPEGGRMGIDGTIRLVGGPFNTPKLSLSSLIGPPVLQAGTVRAPPNWEAFNKCRVGSYPSSSTTTTRTTTDVGELDTPEAQLRTPTGPSPPDDAVRPATAGTGVTRLTDRGSIDSWPALARRDDENLAVWAAHRDGRPAEYGRSIAVATRSSGGWSDRTYLTDADGESHHYPAVAADGDRALAAWIDYDLSAVDTFADLDENADLEVAIDNGGGFGSPTTITGSLNPPEDRPTVAPLAGASQWVVAWESSTTTSGSDERRPTVEYAVVSADGSVSREESISGAEFPALATASTGASLVYYDTGAGEVVRDRVTAGGRSNVTARSATVPAALAATETAAAWVPDEDEEDDDVTVQYLRDGSVGSVPLPEDQDTIDDLALTETDRGVVLTGRRNGGRGSLDGFGYQLDAGGTWRQGHVAATTGELADGTLTVWKPSVAPAADGDGILALVAAKTDADGAVDDLFAVSQPFRPTYAVSATAGTTGVEPGTDVNVSVTVRNAGDVPGSSPIPVEARSGGETLAETTVSPLDPGETASGTLTVTLDETGTVEVVAGDGLPSLVPSAARTTVEVSSPSLAPGGIAVDRPSDSSATATVEIENRGPIDAGSFGIELTDGDATVGTATIPSVPADGTNSATVDFDPTAIDYGNAERLRIDPDRTLPDSHVERRLAPATLGSPALSVADRVDYRETSDGVAATLLVTNTGPVGTDLSVTAVPADATAGRDGYADADVLGTGSGSVSAAVGNVAQTAELTVSLAGVSEGDRVRYVLDTPRPTAGAGVTALTDEVAAVLASEDGESGPVDRADDDDDGSIDDSELRRAIVEWSRGIFTDSELRDVIVEWASG